MSHELRTPLNSILGYTQILLKNPGVTANLRETIAIIDRSGEHMHALINDSLELARIEAGRLHFGLHPEKWEQFPLPVFHGTVRFGGSPRIAGW